MVKRKNDTEHMESISDRVRARAEELGIALPVPREQLPGIRDLRAQLAAEFGINATNIGRALATAKPKPQRAVAVRAEEARARDAKKRAEVKQVALLANEQVSIADRLRTLKTGRARFLSGTPGASENASEIVRLEHLHSELAEAAGDAKRFANARLLELKKALAMQEAILERELEKLSVVQEAAAMKVEREKTLRKLADQKAKKKLDRAEAAWAARVHREKERLKKLLERERKPRKTYPSQEVPQLPAVRMRKGAEWLREAAEAYSWKHDQSIAHTVRKALMAEVVDTTLPEIMFLGEDLQDYVPASRLPIGYRHITAMIEKTVSRMERKYKRSVSKGDVIRTALARFLKREGFGPK